MNMQAWQQGWDQEPYASFLMSKDGKEFITFESMQSAQLKGQWARQQGYRGVFISNVSQDDINNDNVLAHAARNGFMGVK
jgi:GH18 family chitinase